jgi:hypothetical protein
MGSQDTSSIASPISSPQHFALSFFNDADGIRTGTKQTVWEITPTVAYQIYPGLTFRVEYRHDESSKRFFEGKGLRNPLPDGPTTRLFSGQDTVAGELLYSF